MKKYLTVTEFIDDLDDEKRIQVQTLREIILNADSTLAEHIKWNSPSYVKDDEDRITFNLQNKQNVVNLVLHMGATKAEDKNGKPVMDDVSGLITWNSNIRGMMTFQTIESIESQKESIARVLRDWLAIN